MDRCHGTTKAGTRCKHSIPDGQEYCSAHADQAPGGADSTVSADSDSAEDTGLLDTLFVLAAAGAIIAVGLIFRRSFRLL